MDLSKENCVVDIAAAVEDLDVGLVVANAGAGGGGVSFLEKSVADWQPLINLNVHTPMALCHHFAAPMLKRGHGGLLWMSSGVALGGQPRTSVYSASKAFGLNLSESLWAEFKPRGVDVLSVVAPLINTPTLRRGLGDREVKGKIPGMFEPEEVVKIALEQLPIGPCYVFPAGPEADRSEAVTAQRRKRLQDVTEIAAIIFGAEK